MNDPRQLAQALSDAVEVLAVTVAAYAADPTRELRAELVANAGTARKLADDIIVAVLMIPPREPPGDGVGDMTPKPATAPEHPPIT